MTQLSQQKLAESMAEFLGWSKSKIAFYQTSFEWTNHINALERFFFDPNGNPPAPKGFFLVWKQLNIKNKEPLLCWIEFFESGDHKGMIGCDLKYSDHGLGYGGDFLTAFYSAVREMMKNEN